MKPAKTPRPSTPADPLEGRTPPNNRRLEEQVLGAIMLQQEAIDTVIDILTPDTFYLPEHQTIYRAILTLRSSLRPIDLTTVCETLLSEGAIASVGGIGAVSALTASVSSAAHILYHAQLLREKYILRRISTQCAILSAQALDPLAKSEDLITALDKEAYSLATTSLTRSATPISDLALRAISHVESVVAAASQGKTTGVPTSFPQLDTITAGLQPSDLIIIAARPSMGKTAFTLSLALNVAVRASIPTAFFSLEMSAGQITLRALSSLSSVPMADLRRGSLTQEQWRPLYDATQTLRSTPLYIDDTPALSVLEFRTKARRLVHDHQVRLIIIDYLQLMNAQGMQFYSREGEVSLISRTLKAVAKELDIPIIALSQLNRAVESRGGVEGKRPQLSDLRESGAIEQDADIVAFIHRPEYYGITADPKNPALDLRGVGQLIISKNRNGSLADINLRFEAPYARFSPLADPTMPF